MYKPKGWREGDPSPHAAASSPICSWGTRAQQKKRWLKKPWQKQWLPTIFFFLKPQPKWRCGGCGPIAGANGKAKPKQERRIHRRTAETRRAGKDDADTAAVAVASETRAAGKDDADTAAVARSPEKTVVQHGRGPSTAGKPEEQGHENTVAVAGSSGPPVSESVPEKATPVAESPEKPVERAAAVAANPGKVVVKQERTGSATGMQEEEDNEKKESVQSEMEPKTDSSSAVAGGTPEEPKPVPHADLVRRAQPATDGVEGRGETHVRASRSPAKSESQCAEEDALPSFPSTPSPSREVVKEEAASDSTSEDGINEEQ